MMLGEHEGAHHCRPSDEQTSVDQNYYGSVQASVHPRPVSDQQGGFSHGGYPPGYIGGQRILPPPVGVEKYYAPGAPGSLIDASGQQHPYAGSSSVVLPSRYEMPTPPHQRPTMKMEHRDGYSADCGWCRPDLKAASCGVAFAFVFKYILNFHCNEKYELREGSAGYSRLIVWWRRRRRQWRRRR